MKLKKEQVRKARVELIPLIDVVFLLLVFFIYSIMSMSYHSIIPVNLAGVSTGERAEQGTSLIIGISENGTISIGTETVTLELLELRLKEARNGPVQILIAGDADASYKRVMEVCDTVRKSGITDFAFQLQSIED